MEKQHPVPLSSEEILALNRSEGLADYEGWRQAVAQFNQQGGKHTATTTRATTSPGIPLGESVLTSKTATPPGAPTINLSQPPVNAAGENHILSTCKSDDPSAKERLRENTKRLVDSGVAKKLSIDRTVGSSIFERTEIPDFFDADTNTEAKQKRAQAAHALYLDAIAAVDKIIEKRS